MPHRRAAGRGRAACYPAGMRTLTLFTLIVGVLALPGCNEKSDGTETGTSGTTAPDDTTTDPDPTTSTTEPEPTSSGTGDTSGTGTTGDTTGPTTGDPLDEDCAFLVGKKFASKQQFPCGPQRDPNDPVEMCPDRISFEAENFFYQSSDFGLAGTYTCEAGVIVGLDDINETYNGTIDAAKAELVWEDVVFGVE